MPLPVDEFKHIGYFTDMRHLPVHLPLNTASFGDREMKKISLSLAFGLVSAGCLISAPASAYSMFTVDLDSRSDIGSLKYLNLTAGNYSIELLSQPGEGNDSWSFWNYTTCAQPSCPADTATGWVHYFGILSNEITSLVGIEDNGSSYNGQTMYDVFDYKVYPIDIAAREAFSPVHFSLDNDAEVGFWLPDSIRTDNRGGLLLKVTEKPTVPIPTPALLPGLIGMSVAALRKRKQEAAAEA